MRNFVITVIAIALVGGPIWLWVSAPYPFEAALMDRFVDPDSVQIRRVVEATDRPGQTKFCGEVNARNRAGGYSGFEPFVAIGSGSDFRIYVLSAAGALMPPGC